MKGYKFIFLLICLFILSTSSFMDNGKNKELISNFHFSSNINEIDSVYIEYWKIDLVKRFSFYYSSTDSSISIKNSRGSFSLIEKESLYIMKFQKYIQDVFLSDQPYIISKDLSPVSDYSSIRLKIYFKDKSVRTIKVVLEAFTVFSDDFNDFRNQLDELILNLK